MEKQDAIFLPLGKFLGQRICHLLNFKRSHRNWLNCIVMWQSKWTDKSLSQRPLQDIYKQITDEENFESICVKFMFREPFPHMDIQFSPEIAMRLYTIIHHITYIPCIVYKCIVYMSCYILVPLHLFCRFIPLKSESFQLRSIFIFCAIFRQKSRNKCQLLWQI